MSVDIEAFLAIQKALADRLSESWRGETLRLRKALEVKLARKEWDEARALVDTLNVDRLIADNLPYIRYSAYASLFFGASRLTDDLKKSAIARGGLVPIVGHAVRQARLTMERNLLELVRLGLLGEISDLEEEDKKATLESIQKFNPYHDELGRFTTKEKNVASQGVEHSEEFKAWFGDSKAVDKNGNPVLLFRGTMGGRGGIPEGALALQPREGYAVFSSTSPYVAASYGSLDNLSHPEETAVIIPFYVKATELIEYPVRATSYGLSFDKFDFDKKAAKLRPGQVLVARNVYDYGPRANEEQDPERLYSHASDIYAFGRGTETRSGIAKVEKAERVVREFQSFNDGEALLQLIAGLHTSRLSAYGFTVEADVLGVEEYAVSEQLDSRICPVCAVMHGKSFLVDDARRSLDTVLHLDDPDKIKQYQPWPRQSKEAVEELKRLPDSELIIRNWHIPPYHPNCRGLLVHVDKVPRIEDLPSSMAALMQTEPSYFHTKDMFEAYGVKADRNAIKMWNSQVRQDIGSVLSKLKGQLPTDLMESIFSGATGDTAIKAVEDGIVITFTDTIFEASGPVTVSMRYSAQNASIEFLTLAGGPDLLVVLGQKALPSWHQLWRSLNISQVYFDLSISSDVTSLIRRFLSEHPLA